MLKTKEEIIDWLDKHSVENYTINEDLSVDVNGNVDFIQFNLRSIDVQFNIVNGNFYCSYNNLTSTKGSPKTVNGSLIYRNNNLLNLDGCSKKVKGSFDCSYNELTSLEGCPLEIGHNFFCESNKLLNLDFLPIIVGGFVDCSKNEFLEQFKEFIELKDIKKRLETIKNKELLDLLLKAKIMENNKYLKI